MQAAPVRVGLLFDFPQVDSGASFEAALKLGFAEVASAGRLDRELEVLKEQPLGLPGGTAHAVETAFRALDEAGALTIIGPSVSDNGVYVKDLADRSGIPSINYTGGEITRSEMMFHYQVGSLEEEPVLIAEHLDELGHRSVVAIHDDSPVGRGYEEWFEVACRRVGIEVAAVASLPPLSEDAGAHVERVARAKPDALVYMGLGVVARTVALAVIDQGWDVPVVANSALMFGYAQRDWRQAWEGWTYVDTLSDGNTSRMRLREQSKALAGGPLGVAAYDVGRLLGEGIVASNHLTRSGIHEGLQRVKRMRASSGVEGTVMGFGKWDHAALKGDYLVLRQWKDGRSVEVRRPATGSSG